MAFPGNMKPFFAYLWTHTPKHCMKTLLILSLLLFATLIPTGCKEDKNDIIPEQDRRFAESLSNSCITCIEEDDFGHLWIGTERGLNKYDGQRYEQFFHTKDSTSIFSNRVTALMQAKDGTLWVGTSTGISSLGKDGKFTQYKINAFSHFVGIIAEHEGKTYISTLGCLLVLDKDSGCFDKVIDLRNTQRILGVAFSGHYAYIVYGSKISRFYLPSWELSDTVELPSTCFSACYDGVRYMYVGHDDGLVRVDLQNFTEAENVVEGLEINDIEAFGDGVMLLASGNKAYTYDSTGRRLAPLGPVKDLNGSTISVIHRDKCGNVWLGSSSNGISVLYDYEMRFYNEDAILKTSMSGRNITAVATDPEGRLWMVTDHHSLFVSDNDKIKEIDLQKMTDSPLSGQHVVTDIYASPDGDIWISIVSGLLHCRYSDDGGLKLISVIGIFRGGGIWNSPVFDYVIQSSPMQADAEGNLWFGNVTGDFYCIQAGSDSVQKYPISKPEFTHMGAMCLLSDGNIAAGFYGRGVSVINPKTRQIVEEIPLTDIFSDRVYITAVAEDLRGNIWVGSRSEGVVMISPDRAIHSVRNLSCNDICGIVCDKRGDVWMSTYDGISRFSSTTGDIMNYTKEDGIGGNQFNYHSLAISDEGKLYFGGTHGLTVVNPAEAIRRGQDISFGFEDLFLNNRLETPFLSGVLDAPLSESREIIIPHDKRQVTITFAAIDYSQQYHVRYAYAIDGGDNPNWINIGKSGGVSVAEMPYGRHKLSVRMESPEYPSLGKTISLTMRVKRPLFLSHFALMLYLLLASCIVWRFITLSVGLYRSRLEQASEKKRNEMNMRFFSNISHEFRTPLTMINGAVRQLQANSEDGATELRLKGIIARNSERMTKLVNQIMDFGRLDSDVMRLEVKNADIVPLMDRIVDEFKFAASQRKICLAYRKSDALMEMWLDEDKVEKTVYNILSNAFKFTPSGGKISIDLDKMSIGEAEKYFRFTEKERNYRWCMLRIYNSGSSIPEDKLEAIFGRYTQLEEGARVGGTGIGLYYAKRLVEIHHGHIKAENCISDGVSGVAFSFVIPMNQEAYSEEEKVAESSQSTAIQLSDNHDGQEMQTMENDASALQKPTVLVIDDDYEICFYLKTLLQPEYNVLNENNAEDGLRSIKEATPDIILCDVLMPGMDGFELCSKVKDDLSICHIPFILLTAKYSVEDQIKGLNAGANTYVVKPFDPDYLRAVIRSQLAIRDRTRKALGANTESSKVEDEIVNTLDKKFVADLYSLMEAGISQPDMDVPEMSKALHVSRSQLFYKVKALTGETPHAFFNQYKLNVAAEWILEDKYKISAIAQDLGFDSASYFSVLFKKQFGCLPSEYKRLKG